MQPRQPSKTAYGVACRRAAHQIFDHPLVFEDPFALAILGDPVAAEVRATPPEELNHPFHQTMRFRMAVRSRYAEDKLAEAVSRGVRQYVILGAGLDTSAYRCPFPGLAIYEVDFPATQAWKQQRVTEAGLPIPPGLIYAPVDFEHQTLGEGLTAAGFRPDAPAFFSWLGVVPYLTREAFFSTLCFIASLPSGSAVVFDYSMPSHLLGEQERRVLEALAARVAALGEPFRSSYEPEELARNLHAMGFTAIEDLDLQAINERYFKNRADGFRLYGKGGHLLCAQV